MEGVAEALSVLECQAGPVWLSVSLEPRGQGWLEVTQAGPR